MLTQKKGWDPGSNQAFKKALRETGATLSWSLSHTFPNQRLKKAYESPGRAINKVKRSAWSIISTLVGIIFPGRAIFSNRFKYKILSFYSMKVYLTKNEISFDGRKESLLVSYATQNCSDEREFRKKINNELLGFVDIVPEMGPEHLIVVRWHSGYELGYPTDYYGLGAIACESIKPWRYHEVDHIIQHKNPFGKIINAKLLNQISLDYDSRTALIKEGNDGRYNYFLPQVEINEALEKLGFNVNYSSF